MQDKHRTKDDLIAELKVLRQRVKDFEVLKNEIRQSEEKLRIKDKSLETSMNGVVIFDLTGNLTYANRSALIMWGFDDLEDVLGRHLMEFAQDQPEAGRIMKKLIAQGNYAGGLKSVRKDGALFDIQFYASLVRDEKGLPICMMFSCADITEHKKAEEIRAHLSAIVESSDDAIISETLDGTIQTWNAGAERIYGYSAREVIGRPASILVPPGCPDENYNTLERITQESRIQHHETVRMRKDGGSIYVSLTVSPIKDSTGKFIGISTIARDITERKQMEETMRRQASHDALTDLPNRMVFMDRLNLELNQARRHNKILSVLFLDLDYFKDINDTLGHTAGDQLLREIAQKLRTCIRDTDTIARIGGDEFNILLPDISNEDDAASVARKVVSVFETFHAVEGRELQVTASVGISLYPADGEDADTLLRNADAAMYHAKAQGRNNYQFYSSAINVRENEKSLLENNLRQMIQRRELLVYYMPQLNIDSRKMVCAEALVRWQHPELGLLEPKQFMRQAEELGFIMPIDELVLRTACAQNRLWQASGYPPMGITVNLSASQFHQTDFVHTISGVLSDTGMDSRLLEIEITEDTVMQNVDSAISNLGKLADMGVRACIDDFGAGLACMSTLKKLPVRKLKIDRSFIQGIKADPAFRDIISKVITMAHGLNLEVVAEGVETNDQLVFLSHSRCDGMQGYLFSEPLPAGRFEKLRMVHK